LISADQRGKNESYKAKKDTVDVLGTDVRMGQPNSAILSQRACPALTAPNRTRKNIREEKKRFIFDFSGARRF
jgi:hypothetical protein